MRGMTFVLVWLSSVALGALLAAALPRTRWWVGAISCAALGPLGLTLIALDVATYREVTSSPT